MSAPTVVKTEPGVPSQLTSRILSLCREVPQGISDKALQSALGDVDSSERAAAINRLLHRGSIDLFKSSEKGLLYRARGGGAAGGGGEGGGAGGAGADAGGGGGRPALKGGDSEEKLVYRIIEEAGNKGTWIRDIRIKSNLVQTQLNKVLRSLKSKKLIKDVKSVNSTRKIVYMLYDLEPDRSVTGGAWYSDQDFESEFVEILNQQCHRFLQGRLERARARQAGAGGEGGGGGGGPLAQRRSATATVKEVLDFISELGISKVQLKADDIETILNTLVYDGKAERTVVAAAATVGGGDSSSSPSSTVLYRSVDPLLPATGLMRTPCGGCPVIRDCGEVGAVHPNKCPYVGDWMQL